MIKRHLFGIILTSIVAIAIMMLFFLPPIAGLIGLLAFGILFFGGIE